MIEEFRIMLRRQNRIKKIGMLLSILYCVCMCVGCDVENERTKEEAFENIEAVSNCQEIDINFAYKDKKSNERMHNFDSFMLGVKMTSDWGSQMIPGVFISPYNKKLGICIKAKGNLWEVRDLYHQNHNPRWGEAELEDKKMNEKDDELKTIYQNAIWELEPLRDDFTFWIEDFTDIPKEEILFNDKKTDLLNVVDKVTGTKFTISLVEVKIVSVTISEPEIMY